MPEERGHITTPPRVGLTGRLHPFLGRGVPRAFRARPATYRRPRPGVRPPPLEWDGGVPRRGGPWRARCCAPTAPSARPLRAHNVGLPCGHGVSSDDPRREERAPQVLRETARQVPVRVGVLLRGKLQGAVNDPEGGHEVPARVRGGGAAVALCRSEPSVHPGRCGVERAKESLQPVVAELPQEVSQPEHVLEELVYGGPSWRVVNARSCASAAGGTSPEQKTFHRLGAGGTPRSHP